LGLENLKSAFSNIETFNQSDLTQMSSVDSIKEEPQEVDYMRNSKASGFSANQFGGNVSLFAGIKGTDWSSTTGFYNTSNVDFPGPVDWLYNDHASGFSLYQEHQSPTKFIGAGEHSTVPYMEWTNNSLYGDVLGNTYSFDNGLPAIDATTWDIPTGFTYQNSQYGVNAISDTFSEEWSYTNNIPPHGTTWNTGEESLTSYYDSIHTTNAISDTFGGPVNFLYDVSATADGIGFTPLMTNGYSEQNIYGTSNFLTQPGDEQSFRTTTTHEITYYDSGIATAIPITFNEGALQSIYEVTNVEIQSGIKVDSSKGPDVAGDSPQFSTLYTNAHTTTGNKFLGTLGQNLNAQHKGVRDIGSDNYNVFSRIADDTLRIGDWFLSAKGLQFTINQNILGTFQQYQGLYDPSSTLASAIIPSEGLSVAGLVIPVPFIPIKKSSGGLVELAELLPSVKKYNADYPEYLELRKDSKEKTKTYAEMEREHTPLGFKKLGGGYDSNLDTNTPIEKGGVTPESGIGFTKNVNNSMNPEYTPFGEIGKGDLMTLMAITKPDNNNLSAGHVAIGETVNGLPFYFRDLRDGSLITFRAYVEGLSDTISPNWNSENYVGRSEPVYTYTNAERELSFSLKLFANTKDELNIIYTKMNRLASLCYPEYKSEQSLRFKDGEIDVEATTAATNALGTSRVMMKAPLTKFRLGELFGSSTSEMVGFIKSLSFSFPDESPWEIQNGYRVPKFITAEFGYQVIHSEVPSLDFARIKDSQENPTNGNSFYGINQKLGVEMEKVGVE
jgi:hypothetical protein